MVPTAQVHQCRLEVVRVRGGAAEAVARMLAGVGVGMPAGGGQGGEDFSAG